MAFHPQARQSLHRPLQPTSEAQDVEHYSPRAPQAQQAPDESQTWVLFSPGDNATASSYLGESDRSLQTAGRSRASDFGSLDSNLRSDLDLDAHSQSLEVPATIDEDLAEDDAELDSLDSHLPEFRAIHNPYLEPPAPASQSVPVLPRHDGLGSFKIEQPAAGPEMQERLYAFERFNPHRVAQRDDVPDLPDLFSDPDMAHKMNRIESWRLEQSRLLLEHIQKETRTRRMSQSSAITGPPQSIQSNESESTQVRSEETLSGIVQGEHDNVDWHQGGPSEGEVPAEGILSRIAKNLIKELVGIDDHLILAILFGEALPEDVQDIPTSSSTQGPENALVQSQGPSWQLRFLETMAKELGFLINRLSHHPGAFSTYSRMQRMPLPYAGLPVIPETPAGHFSQEVSRDQDGLSATMPEFRPTAPRQSPVGETQSLIPQVSGHEATPASQHSASFTQDEWEQDLDIRLAFRYLRSRFSSRSSPAPATAGTSHLATSSTQDSAAKAARIRQHHPLVAARPRAVERRSFKVSTPSSPAVIRHASSCASQSTRRSGRRSSVSSRHYWDIGGSLGTGSVIASNGPMGSWGEV